MKIVRINGLVVDLEQCALKRSVDTHGTAIITVHFHDNRFNFYLGDQVTGDGYLALNEYINAQPDLNAYNLRQIAADAFDPFLDEEPSTLYNLMRELPEHEHMTMQLQSDGRGDIRLNGDPIVFWVDMKDGIRRVDEYRRSLAPVEIDESLP